MFLGAKYSLSESDSTPDVNCDYSYDNLGRITQIHAYKSTTDIVKFDYEYEELTNNISLIKFDHRDEDNDPCNVFSYDDIARLVMAEYGLDDANEIFTMDALGNRTNVNVRDTNDITYIVDDLTNRYESVDGNSLEYDSAGNLTADKDGYEYEYDYENRIIEITKNQDTIAQFSYDALGRRIEKKDLITPANTRRYYYSNNWQVLNEYDKDGNFDRLYIYGNYIDEILVMVDLENGGDDYYYAHDHLFSPAALFDESGDIQERYEYDAYGEPTIYLADYSDTRDYSYYGNNYLFTGRELDILDDGSLKIQYNRNRYLDYYTGRWLQRDPLQYADGMNLYEYIKNNPVGLKDPFGLTASDKISIGIAVCKGTMSLEDAAWILSIICGGTWTAAQVADFYGIPNSCSSGGGDIPVDPPSLPIPVYPPIQYPPGGVVIPLPIGIRPPITFPVKIPWDPALPVKPWELAPPGLCTPEVHRNLQNLVEKLCYTIRGCTCNDSIPVILKKISANSFCIAARTKINDKCFGGADFGHRQARRDAINALNNCFSILAKKYGEAIDK